MSVRSLSKKIQSIRKNDGNPEKPRSQPEIKQQFLKGQQVATLGALALCPQIEVKTEWFMKTHEVPEKPRSHANPWESLKI